MDEVTVDRALLFAILKEGVSGLFKAKELGVEADHLEDGESEVFAFVAAFARKGRLPTTIEIKAATEVDIVLPDDPYDVEVFSQQIVRRALQNKLKDGFGPIVTTMVSDPVQARKDMAQLVRDTAWSIGGVTSYTDAAIAREILADYESAKSRTDSLIGLPSPWPDVDRYSLGIQDGELTVILAKRKTGKTWVLLKWFVHIMRTALLPGESLLIVSMEMPRKQVYRRMAAIDLRLNYQDFRAGRLTVDEERRLADHCEDLMTPDPNRPTIHVACADTVRDVSDICDLVSEKRSKAVGVDGLYILGRDKRMGMWERTITNCSEIKLDLCTLGVGVVATTQLKGTKDKNSLEANADDAAYAKAIGDWADAMRGLFMNDEYESRRMRRWNVMETREFRGVDMDIAFDLRSMNFDQIKVHPTRGLGGEEGEDEDEATTVTATATEEGGPVIDGAGAEGETEVDPDAKIDVGIDEIEDEDEFPPEEISF